MLKIVESSNDGQFMISVTVTRRIVDVNAS